MPKASDSILAAEALIDKNLPKGWRKVFVEPPWSGTAPMCRGCGADPAQSAALRPVKWANVAIVKHDQSTKTLFYSFGLCCAPCAGDRTTMNRITLEVFKPLGPAKVTDGSRIIS